MNIENKYCSLDWHQFAIGFGIGISFPLRLRSFNERKFGRFISLDVYLMGFHLWVSVPLFK